MSMEQQFPKVLDAQGEKWVQRKLEHTDHWKDTCSAKACTACCLEVPQPALCSTAEVSHPSKLYGFLKIVS